MFIETKKHGVWHIEKAPSIFTFRNGKVDIRIRQRSGPREGGVMLSDGFFYITAQCFAAENGAIISNYMALPPDITPELLRQWGFLD